MKITVLSGGVGGARFLRGLLAVVPYLVWLGAQGRLMKAGAGGVGALVKSMPGVVAVLGPQERTSGKLTTASLLSNGLVSRA